MMMKKKLIKTLAMGLIVLLSVTFDFVKTNAEEATTIEEAKKSIVENYNYYWKTAVEENNRYKLNIDDLKDGYETTLSNGYDVTLPNEKVIGYTANCNSMLEVQYGITSKNVYIRTMGTCAGELAVLNNKCLCAYYTFARETAHPLTWYHDTGWIHMDFDENWYYLKNGIVQKGWIQYNKKWYYCYDNGVMAKNTIIEGYKLGSDGAWIK